VLFVDSRQWPTGEGPHPFQLFNDVFGLLAVSFGIRSVDAIADLVSTVNAFLELDDPNTGFDGFVSLNGEARFTRRSTYEAVQPLSEIIESLHVIITSAGWPLSDTDEARSLDAALRLYAESLEGLAFELPEAGRGRPKSRVRKAVLRIARTWPKLVGASPTAWRGSYDGIPSGWFYEFTRAVLALHEKDPPSVTAIKSWLSKDLKKPPPD
jgi:hypothetical protein